MKVIEAFRGPKPALSFEFFPPKSFSQEQKLFEVISQLKKFKPGFVSVTYGAMGTTREKTFFWVKEIKEKLGIEPVAHLTCVAAGKEDIARQLDELEAMGVENILALRGDPPEGMPDFVPPADGFRYARDLISFIKKRKPNFCLGCAGFPEGHPRAPSIGKDTEYLKEKIDAGAEYVITQLFFDNQYFYEFAERCKKAGIEVPIIAGLMPITNLKQIKRMTDTCGATIPSELQEKLEQAKADPKALLEIGAEQAFSQSIDLLRFGVRGLHFFVLNRAEPISTLLSRIFT